MGINIFRWGPTGQLDTICNVKTQVVIDSGDGSGGDNGDGGGTDGGHFYGDIGDGDLGGLSGQDAPILCKM